MNSNILLNMILTYERKKQSRFRSVSALAQSQQKHLPVLNFSNSVDFTQILKATLQYLPISAARTPQVQIASFVATALTELKLVTVQTNGKIGYDA